ncbi:MAG: hypothetical protein ACYDDF_09915 [Thermoplasmatota archaeon]
MTLRDVLVELEDDEADYRGEVAPGVHVFAANRPMSRVRAHQTASVTPLGGRGAPSEVVLLAHVHEDRGGMVAIVEGFNGAEGEKLAGRLGRELSERGLMPPGAAMRPSVPLRMCPQATRPVPERRM